MILRSLLVIVDIFGVKLLKIIETAHAFPRYFLFISPFYKIFANIRAKASCSF